MTVALGGLSWFRWNSYYETAVMTVCDVRIVTCYGFSFDVSSVCWLSICILDTAQWFADLFTNSNDWRKVGVSSPRQKQQHEDALRRQNILMQSRNWLWFGICVAYSKRIDSIRRAPWFLYELLRRHALRFAETEVAYSTDCCHHCLGVDTIQYRLS